MLREAANENKPNKIEGLVRELKKANEGLTRDLLEEQQSSAMAKMRLEDTRAELNRTKRTLVELQIEKSGASEDLILRRLETEQPVEDTNASVSAFTLNVGELDDILQDYAAPSSPDIAAQEKERSTVLLTTPRKTHTEHAGSAAADGGRETSALKV